MQNYGLQQNLSTHYRRSFAVYRMYSVKIYKANHPTTLLLFSKSFKWWGWFLHYSLILSPAHFITGLAMNLCQWRVVCLLIYVTMYVRFFVSMMGIELSIVLFNVAIIFRRAKGMVKNVRFKMNTFFRKRRKSMFLGRESTSPVKVVNFTQTRRSTKSVWVSKC